MLLLSETGDYDIVITELGGTVGDIESQPFLEKGESLLLDGFPRTVVQAEALEKSVHVDMVVNLDIPSDTIIERLTDR